MVKLCPIFIIATTVIILMSFGVLCYLLRTINPKPIPENARKHDSIGSNPPSTEFMQELQQDDSLEYGLEKIPDNVNLNAAKPAYTINNINSFSSGDRTIVSSIWPDIKKNNSDAIKQENETTATDLILSQIKGQRRSIRNDDENLNYIKIPNSLLSKIIIQLGSENNNKRRGRKRSSSNRQGDYNKTVITIEVNESLILNVIGNSVDVNTKSEVERNIFQSELEFDNSTLNDQNELNKNDIIIYNINFTDVDNAYTNSIDILTVTSNYNDSETYFYNTNIIDFVKNETIDLTEELTYANITDSTIANNTVSDKLSTITELNDLVMDLMIRGEMLKDNPLRNKTIYETANAI